MDRRDLIEWNEPDASAGYTRPALTPTHTLLEVLAVAESHSIASAPEVESWKDIPDHVGYQASTWGRIRSFWKQKNRLPGTGSGWMSFLGSEPTILTPKVGPKGYLTVKLRESSGKYREWRLNRLILITFVGPCPVGMEACHDPDRNPANNRLDNLRWATHSENLMDAGRHGTRKTMQPDQIAEMIRLDEAGLTRREIASRFGVRPSAVSRILARNGRPSLRHPLDDDQIAEAVRLQTEGLPHRKIAARIGAKESTVYYTLRRLSG